MSEQKLFEIPLLMDGCPQCGSEQGMKQPRGAAPYCEDCGWPDEDFVQPLIEEARTGAPKPTDDKLKAIKARHEADTKLIDAGDSDVFDWTDTVEIHQHRGDLLAEVERLREWQETFISTKDDVAVRAYNAEARLARLVEGLEQLRRKCVVFQDKEPVPGIGFICKDSTVWMKAPRDELEALIKEARATKS